MKSSCCARSGCAFRQIVCGVALVLGLISIFISRPAFAQRPVGLDVSDYQASMSWSSVKTSGVSFAWAKATEGLTEVEATFTNNMINAKAAGILIGTYHFAHPELHSPDVEAAHFWSVAGSYITGGGSYLMPMLDFEVFTNVVGASSYSDWFNQWCNIIVSNAAAVGVPIKPMIYVSVCNACTYDT